jgi:hypothetical protein
MIKTVADLKRALEAYPDDWRVQIWSHRLSEFKAPIVIDYEDEEEDVVHLEPRHVRSDLRRMSKVRDGR